MLYFSKLRIFIISVLTIVFTYFACSNFINSEESFFKRNINLGLDLQGGSYLLLEIDNTSVITETLQSKIYELKRFFKKNNIKTGNFSLNNKIINFSVDKIEIDKVKNFLDNDDSSINQYYEQFKSHQFDISNDGNNFSLTLSKYGLINIKNSSLDQSIEIVRRRVDEIGTNEPTILKRGNDRILVELPGLKDPNRIKNLLGKTAKLSFQLVTQSENETFGTQKMITEDGDQVMVSKRIILSGDNLLDAKPNMDTETNETAVLFTLDRVGAKKFGKVTSNGIGKRLAIVLDNKIISAPVIQDAIVTGTGRITGDFTFQSATDLALLLRSGALPAPLNIIEERSVGPDLGQDSINAGIFSLIIGFSLVILFMIYKYRIFGIIANLTLILNLFITPLILSLSDSLSICEVFLLLIFFMLTSTAMKHTQEVDLPEAQTSELNSKPNLVVLITPEGKIQLEGISIPIDGLSDALEEKLRVRKEKIVEIQADKNIGFELFGNVIAVAKQAGAVDFIFATKRLELPKSST